MSPGAAVASSGSDICHGTGEHDEPGTRRRGCQAHISLVAQTPAPVAGVSRRSAKGMALHTKLLACGAADTFAPDSRWRPEQGCVWLAVHHSAIGRGQVPRHKLKYNKDIIRFLPYKRLVLYDVATELPLVLFDAEDGLQGEDAVHARDTFAFLEDFNFTLNRMKESKVSSRFVSSRRGG
jgi:hypothetical protein